jgi:hypothetical protein
VTKNEREKQRTKAKRGREGAMYVKKWVDDFLEGRAVAPARADELGEDARVLNEVGR